MVGVFFFVSKLSKTRRVYNSAKNRLVSFIYYASGDNAVGKPEQGVRISLRTNSVNLLLYSLIPSFLNHKNTVFLDENYSLLISGLFDSEISPFPKSLKQIVFLQIFEETEELFSVFLKKPNQKFIS